MGEGGSGGALAIGVGDRILMFENSIYSVITPEGCAAILWKDAGRSEQAAECLRLTAKDLREFGLIDEIIPETRGWKFPSEEDSDSSLHFTESLYHFKEILLRHLKELEAMDQRRRIKLKFEKFRNMGEWVMQK